MEGKELLSLLDLVKQLETKAETLETASKEAVDNSTRIESKASAKVYKEVAKELDKLLREINS